MDSKDMILRLRNYNKTLSPILCTALEKQYIKYIEERDYFYGFAITELQLPESAEKFFRQQNYFRGLLKNQNEKLCGYLRHIQEYTCNDERIRMDARSRNFARYRRKVLRAVGTFYLFYGAGMSMKDLVYGAYRDLFYNADFSPVIAAELLEDNQEVIQYCRDVLTSENNTAVLTRDVIIAVEQSHNRELQQILTQVFLAAKLQEGLRQSVAETVDENNLDYFLEMTEVIERENLLRFSSVQRAVLTWIGIGYDEVKEKDVRYIFGNLCRYLRDESARKETFFKSENPLDIYLALYCRGVFDVETAMEEACGLLQSQKRYVVASALIYLKLTCCFEIREHLDFPEIYKDDEWILALFFSECVRADCGRLGLTKQEARQLFGEIEAFLPKVGARKTFSSKGFGWFSVTLMKDSLCYSMHDIIWKYPEADLIERFLPYAASALTGSRLDRFMEKEFGKASEPARKVFMQKEILSSNEALGKWIEKEYQKVSLTEADIIGLEGRLKSKKAKARAHIVNVLAAQSEEMVKGSYERLIGSTVKTIRESAMELRNKVPQYFPKETMIGGQGVSEAAAGREGTSEAAAGRKGASEAAVGRQGVSEITAGGQTAGGRAESHFWEPDRSIPILGKEKGFGLYTPKQVYEVPYLNTLKVTKKGLFRKVETVDLSFLLVWNKAQILDYIRRWNDRIIRHENDEYYTGYEYRQVKDQRFWPVDRKKRSLEAMPLSEVWQGYFDQDCLSADVIFEIQFMLLTVHDNIYWEKILKIPSELFTLCQEDVKKFCYYSHFEKLFGYYFQEWEQKENYAEKASMLLQLLAGYSKEKSYKKQNMRGITEVHSLMNNQSIFSLQQMLHLENIQDEQFRRYFPVVFHLYQQFTVKAPDSIQSKMAIEPLMLARAVLLGMIPKEALYEGILDKHMMGEGSYYYRNNDNQLFEAYRDAYFEGRGIWGMPHLNLKDYHPIRYEYDTEVYETLRNALDEITNTLLAMESNRLNEKTQVTDYVERLRIIRGVDSLILALHVLEGENLCRQSYGDDRAAVFSNVIRHCYPAEIQRAGAVEQTRVVEQMGAVKQIGTLEAPSAAVSGRMSEEMERDAEKLASAGFSEARLVEAAMLAPQWIDTVNQVLKWDGFKIACYYFTAHMKQYDFQQKKAEIARYTELEPEDLQDGAFDMEWCRRVYETLGEKRFNLLYQSSKFLCDNSFHTRARKYADACLGKTGKESWRKQAEEKRNKDALNAYCICPLEDDADLLERYLYVQQFLKESRKYGSQRQASEKRAVEMAMLNLARNSRFETVTRLAWMMESEMVSKNSGVLTPQVVQADGSDTAIEVWIEIDEQGSNEICVRKNGKKQKSIPAAFKKKEQILELKEIHSQWTEQYRRSRKMLEQAMEERTVFSKEELDVIMKNPIVAPMMGKLVLLSGNHSGFYEDGKLRGVSGTADLENEIRIAHPFDLYAGQCWHLYQKMVFDAGMVQPFKQVFRELYLKLDEERDTSESRRYSGYQIQTKKAAAALKGRRWNVSYENGLERIYYKENLVVNLFAEADWFSPSDIEAPSIEYVMFYSRKEGKQVLIREIDDVTFSETMRDIDLAVSTAYVGGVDPITSFSTMELRRTIVEYTCQLMKLNNVTVREHFADIKGVLNDYSVHLGSGMVHQSGGAAIHMIAVHSGKRGKVYLPFLDEDPKTAEILSKIVMLAEDGKIKDPMILRQIHSGYASEPVRTQY